MIKQVYETLKAYSRKGDFVHLTKQDIKDLDIDLTEEDIQLCTKNTMENSINKKAKFFALSS